MGDSLEQCWGTKTQKLTELDLDNVLLQFARPKGYGMLPSEKGKPSGISFRFSMNNIYTDVLTQKAFGFNL